MTKQTKRKLAWITGASSGIGEATARRLAAQGWIVAVSARSEDKLQELAKNFAPVDGGGSLHAYPVDVTDPEAVRNIVEKIEAELGVIDLALLNAGTYLRDRAENFKAETFRKTYEVNVFGVANALECILPKMIARKGGQIAVVSSVAGYRGLPYSLAYGSSKAALINMCEALAAECKAHKVKVQVVCPGFVKTPLTDKNDFPMPMLMDVDDAAEKLVQ